MKELTAQIEQITKLCTKNKVKTLFAFGSITTNKFKEESDIDLVVEIDDLDPMTYSDSYFDLKFQLERILRRPIDLLEQKAIRNPYLKAEIEKSKVLVYAS